MAKTTLDLLAPCARELKARFEFSRPKGSVPTDQTRRSHYRPGLLKLEYITTSAAYDNGRWDLRQTPRWQPYITSNTRELRIWGKDKWGSLLLAVFKFRWVHQARSWPSLMQSLPGGPWNLSFKLDHPQFSGNRQVIVGVYLHLRYEESTQLRRLRYWLQRKLTKWLRHKWDYSF